MTIAANKLITAEEFAAMPESVRGELVRGEIVELPPPSFDHGDFVFAFGTLLRTHVVTRRLGKVVGGDAGFQLTPDTVRGPDVAFVKQARLDSLGGRRGYFPGAPDLAVEVLSPGDRVGDVDDKIDDYLAAGCPLVVILHPKRRTATLHRLGVDPHIVREPEPLDLSPIVVDFRCALAEIFG